MDLLVCGLDAELIHFGTNLTDDLVPGDLDKRCQVGKGDGLTAILVGSDLGNDLCCNVAGGREGMRTLNHGAGDNRSVLQHILQIDKAAVMHVLCEVIRVMEVDDALTMGFHDVLRKENALREVTADLAGHVVSLDAVDRGVLVGVLLLCLLVVALDKADDFIVGSVALPSKISLVTVGDVTHVS